jgi:hypothetical protein
MKTYVIISEGRGYKDMYEVEDIKILKGVEKWGGGREGVRESNGRG